MDRQIIRKTATETERKGTDRQIERRTKKETNKGLCLYKEGRIEEMY